MCGTGRAKLPPWNVTPADAGLCQDSKKEGFYEVERFFCWQSRNLWSLRMTLHEVAMYIQALCHVGKNYAPLQVGKLPSGGTSEERQTREAAWKLWRKPIGYDTKKKKRLFCCKTNVADFKNPRQLLSNIKELMEQVGSGQVPVSLRLRINKRGLKCWNMLKVER